MDGYESSEMFTDVRGLRISPPMTVFIENINEPKYHAKVIFQNISNMKLFVRFRQPKINDFKIDAATGRYLYPGLKIVKTIRVTMSPNCPKQCLLPIYINDYKYDYLIIIKAQSANIVIQPTTLDFGLLNIGMLHVSKIIEVKNDSNSEQVFYIDLKNCGDDVIVEPTKGKIKSKTTYIISVRVVTFKELEIDYVLLIKCAYQITPIQIRAKVIHPKLEVYHPNVTEHFTFLEFSPTYYGLTSTIDVFIRNYSAVSCVFSIMALVDLQLMRIYEIPKDVGIFKHFDMSSVEGMLQPDETRLFRFFFSPTLDNTDNTGNIPFFFCTIFLQAMKYIPLQSITFKITRSSFMHEILNDEKLQALYESEEASYTKFHIYGTAYEASVRIVPDCIRFDSIPINKRQVRIVEIQNTCKHLPIIPRFCKVPYLSVEPDTCTLKPLESIQIAVFIYPTEPGRITTKIQFDLTYFNDVVGDPSRRVNKVIGKVTVPVQFDVSLDTKYPKAELNLGLKPNYIKEVGKFCQNVKFDTNIGSGKCITMHNLLQVDRDRSELVAFPNDRPASIRPWRSDQKCRTMFAHMERYEPPIDSTYELRSSEYQRRQKAKNYYSLYIRNRQLKSKSLVSAKEYEVTKPSKILVRDLVFHSPPEITVELEKRDTFFLPLTPMEIANVMILPPVVRTPKIASHAFYEFHVIVINKNLLPIHVVLSSDKEESVKFSSGTRHVVPKKSEAVLKLAYKSAFVGYYVSNVYFIINGNTVQAVSILAEVITPSLTLKRKEIVLNSSCPHEFLEITNDLNVPIPFSWVLTYSNVTISPSSGTVDPGRKIVCMVAFHYDIEGPNATIAKLYSGTYSYQDLYVSMAMNSRKIVIMAKEVQFGKIPLNREAIETIVMENMEAISTPFKIDVEELPDCLTIFPRKGVIDPLCQFNVYISATFKNCIKFKFFLKIDILLGEHLRIPIVGEVVFPNLVMSPNVISLEKIPSSTTTSAELTIKNNTEVPAKLMFDLKDFDEFLISKSKFLFDSEPLTALMVDGKAKEKIYVHFIPRGASSFFCYLPIIINDILGPPIFNDVVSTKVIYYLTDTVGDTCSPVRTPSTIPAVQIHTLVTSPKIEISRTRITFVTNPIKRYAFGIVHITNVQKVSEKMFIEICHLKPPLYLEDNADATTKYRDVTSKGYFVVLEPNQKITFTVAFKPEKGYFHRTQTVIPIFVKSDHSADPHNVIRVIATQKPPEIVAMLPSDYYYEIMKSTANQDYILEFHPQVIPTTPFHFSVKAVCTDHLRDCELRAVGVRRNNWEFRMPTFEIQKDTKVQESCNTYSVTILGTYKDTCPYFQYNYSFVISCTCGGYCAHVHQGVVANSLLTIYLEIEHHFKGNNTIFVFPSHPLYPENDFVYYEFLNDVLDVTKCWLRTQVMFGTRSYEIPESICYPTFTNDKLNDCHLPLVHLINNLMGSEPLKSVRPMKMSSNATENVKYLFFLYEEIMNIMEAEGVLLGGLRPEHLFYYSAFIHYYKYAFDYSSGPLPSSSSIKDFDTFVRFSKLTWLHFLLQLYQSLYLKRMVAKYLQNGEMGLFKNTPLQDFYLTKPKRIHPHYYTKSEDLVLNWLEFHYNSNRNAIWPNANLKEVSVDLYNDTLCDGVVFATVIVTYCPYLIRFIEDIYLNPKNYEQKYHNLSRVIQCLEKINYSFTITPQQIIIGSSVRILMFSIYLFDVLPHSWPKQVLNMTTGLSTKTSRKLVLENPNDFPIAYKPLILGNELNCFSISVSTPTFEIQPNKSITLNITYWAKYIEEIQATLLLSGECFGYHYATNKCISITGTPDVTFITTTITYKQEMFTIKDIEFLIQSPYKVEATYKLVWHCGVNESGNNFKKMLPVENYDKSLAGRLIPTHSTFNFDKNGQMIFKTAMVTLTTQHIYYWCYFRNKNVGDFGVKFSLLAEDTKQRQKILLSLPLKALCISDRPLKIDIQIPSIDQLMCNILKRRILRFSDPQEAKLWKRLIGTSVGQNIVQHMYANVEMKTNLPSLIYCKPVSYKVTWVSDANVVMPEYVVFEDECTDSDVTVPVIFTAEKLPRTFSFILDSQKTHRRRYYEVKIEYK